MVTSLPDSRQLELITIAETPLYVALQRNQRVDRSAALRLEDLRSYHWILPAPHCNPYLTGLIQTFAMEKNIESPETHYAVEAEEALGLLLAHNGAAFLPRELAWRISSEEVAIRPLAEDYLIIKTQIAARADRKDRLINEYIRATIKRLGKDKYHP